jgi:hypothetical protein
MRPSGPNALAEILRDDARFEPPAAAVAAARALGARIAMRAAGASALSVADRVRMHLVELGSMFDRAGAVVASWMSSDKNAGEARLAFAGLRDDIASGLCADTLSAELVESNLHIDAERTRGQDGVTRLVGEIRARDRSPARASIIVLDASARVVDLVDSDEVGLFTVRLPAEAAELAVVPHASGPVGSTTLYPPSVLPLSSRSVP